MAGWTPSWTRAAAIAALALVPSAIAGGGVAANASVSPTAGYAGVKLIATYSFTPKGSCAAYHNQVSWSFANTMNWASSPVPASTGTSCTSSTPLTAPPSGDAPGSYQVCGMDASVSSTPACATYTIKSPPQAPPPRPAPSPMPIPPSVAPSPLPTQSGAPAAVGGTPSPAAPPSAAPPGATGGGGGNTSQPSGRTAGVIGWPATVLLLVLIVVAVAWRFRSWLMGVFENVEVLGRSGADLEAELLQHAVSPADAVPAAEPEAPTPDPGSGNAAETVDRDGQAQQQT